MNPLRTMQELERDMTQNQIDRCSRLCQRAIEVGHASDAGQFAQAAVRAARLLGDTDAAMVQAERVAEPAQNAASTVRWSNETYTETAKRAGGVLVIRKAA